MQLSPEQLAATAIDDNLVVNAGAGSGKITVLTRRYVRLLEEGGLTPEQIVAITFTRKAAREMRERIDHSLAAKAAGGEERWKRMRDELVTAPIGTIHSFYARILRAFPVEAGIDPGFRVLDETEADMLLTQALDTVFQQAGDAPGLDAVAAVLGAQALEAGSGFARELGNLYRTLLNRGIPAEQAQLSSAYASLPSWPECRNQFIGIAAREPAVAAALGDRDKPELAAVRHDLVQAGKILAGLQDPREALAVYRRLSPLTQLKGGRTKDHKEFVAEATEQLCMFLTATLAPQLADGVRLLLLSLDRTYQAAKARAGGLDFNDLQLTVWRLLHDHPEVIVALRSRYRTYMIDEFQDTNRLQYAIISKLVEEDGNIPPGRLFVVGDEKQSIYRFRGAEVQVFAQVRRRLTETAPQREKRITCNYRSRQPLINLVNGLFSRLMDKSAGSEIEYIDLSAQRPGPGPCAELLVCAPAEEETVAEAEARMLAARIAEMVAKREVTVGDRDGARPVRFGDIAVLIRSRTHLKEYEHHLRLAGIPYTVVAGAGYYNQQEVEDIINLLRAVDNQRDELSLAAALRSPFFGLDDDSLLELARARRERGGSLLDQGAVLEGEPRRRLERAAEIIATLHRSRGRLELPALIQRALDLTMAREINLTRFAGLQCYANLEKFIHLAEQFAGAGGQSLRAFLGWLEYAAAQNEAEAPVDSEETDTVKIMTIHASKGLEFPVVFIPACSAAVRGRYGSLLAGEDGGLVFRFPWSCAVWEGMCAQERRRELEEHKRLLYVAVTRARDWLAVLVRDTYDGDASFNTWLRDFAGRAPEYFLPEQRPATGKANIRLPRPLPPPCPGRDSDITQLFPGLRVWGSGRRALRYFSISQFMLWRTDRDEFDRRYLSQLLVTESAADIEQELGWEHEPGGARFGSLLHRALEVVGSDTDVDAVLDKLVPEFFRLADEALQRRVRQSAGALLAAYQLEPGLQGDFRQSFSEQKFYFRLEDALFYGLIDRVLVADEFVAVLDFKSNRIPPEGIESLRESYAPQLQFYALAAGKIYKKPVRAFLQMLRLPPGRQLVEIDVTAEALRRLEEELKQFVRYCRG